MLNLKRHTIESTIAAAAALCLAACDATNYRKRLDPPVRKNDQAISQETADQPAISPTPYERPEIKSPFHTHPPPAESEQPSPSDLPPPEPDSARKFPQTAPNPIIDSPDDGSSTGTIESSPIDPAQELVVETPITADPQSSTVVADSEGTGLTSTESQTPLASDAENSNQTATDRQIETNLSPSVPPPSDLLGTERLECQDLQGGAFVAIPADQDYQTEAFCLMKYEAKLDQNGQPESRAAGRPQGDISLKDAVQSCESLGSNYHLMTNDRWMAVISNIMAVGTNWTSSRVGLGALISGHTGGPDTTMDRSQWQPCPASTDDELTFVHGENCQAVSASRFTSIATRRTHYLSTQQQIWDLGGNMQEWTLSPDRPWLKIVDFRPANNGYSYLDIADFVNFDDHAWDHSEDWIAKNELVPTMKPFWSRVLLQNANLGKIAFLEGQQASAQIKGDFYGGSNRGLLSTFLLPNDQSSLKKPYVGYRCFYQP